MSWTSPNNAVNLSSVVAGRLTLASATAVTTTDQTAKTTVYYTPHKGNSLILRSSDGMKIVREFAEISVAVPSTTVTPADVWAYDNGGTVTLETLNWTNDTTRATAISLDAGQYIKTGDATRLYLGTLRTTGSSGQCEDSASKRFLWNYYNRVGRDLLAVDTTDNWTYTTATYRAMNNNTTAGVGRVECVIGVSENLISALHTSLATNGSDISFYAGIGIDSTSVNSCQLWGTYQKGGQYSAPVATYEGALSAGYHYIQKLEKSDAVSTTTWHGDEGADKQYGMKVEILA